MKKIEKIINRSLKADINNILQRPFDTEDDDFEQTVSGNALAEYVYHMFEDAIEFHKLNNVYFDDEALHDIKELFIDEVVDTGANEAVVDEVSSHIDRYIQSYKIEGEPKKVMFKELEDIYCSCIDLIKEASKNVKENTCKKNIDDDYIITFGTKLNNLLDFNLFDTLWDDRGFVFVRHLMFQIILKCFVDGGDSKMIDELHTKLEEVFKKDYCSSFRVF